MSKESAKGWSAEEFGEIELGDQRLTQRVIKLAAQLGAQPQAFINQACEDWADAKAAYRFFDNKKVAASQLLSAHRHRLHERMRAHELVLAIQDTTALDYTAHQHKSGLGPIGNGREQVHGLMLHTTLAVSCAGLPLGVLTQQVWAREHLSRRQTYNHKALAIEEKESMKWLTALEQTVRELPAGLKVVAVCDREADIYEFLLLAEQLKTSYLIRGSWDRRLLTEETYLWEKLGTRRVCGRLTVEVAARKGEAGRTATVAVRFGKVKLRPPQRPKSARREGWKPISVWAVYVTEVAAPPAVTPLEWMLVTNLAVQSFAEAEERIKWYCQRWQIEVYHKVLKSGCRVEHTLLETAERLTRYLALMSVVAWRLFWMTQLNRSQAQASCQSILAEHEWQALYCITKKTTVLPEDPPSVREVVRWIGRLGGFLARKGDAEPGVTVIWRGWQRLTDIAETWLLMHPTYG